MSNLVKVVPAEGATIRQPNRNMRIMPPEGDLVSRDDSFYERLIMSGDVKIVDDNPKFETPDDKPVKPEAKAAPSQAAPKK